MTIRRVHEFDSVAPIWVASRAVLPRRVGVKRGRAGFSLIEVVLALGIITFAFLVLFSLIPVGQGMMTKSIDATVGMQIMQRVTTLATQARFSELQNLNINAGTDAKGEKPDYFFDEQGDEVPNASDIRCVYSAAVVLPLKGGVPVGYLPGRSAVDASQSVTTVEQVNSTNFATITVIMKRNNSSNILKVGTTVIANNGL